MVSQASYQHCPSYTCLARARDFATLAFYGGASQATTARRATRHPLGTSTGKAGKQSKAIAKGSRMRATRDCPNAGSTSLWHPAHDDCVGHVVYGVHGSMIAQPGVALRLEHRLAHAFRERASRFTLQRREEHLMTHDGACCTCTIRAGTASTLD
jgi:hypothetical protein